MKNSILSRKNSFHEGAVILLFSTALVKIIGAFFKIPLASDYCLGDLGFGYFSSVYDLFTPFATLALAGIPMAISKLIADNNAKESGISANVLFAVSRELAFKAGIVTAICFASFAVPFSYFTDASYKLVLPILAVIPAVLCCYLVAVYRGLFEGLSNMMPAANSSVIEALGKLIFGFGFAFAVMQLTSNAHFGAFAAIFGISLGTVLSLMYIHRKYKASREDLPNQKSAENIKTIKKIIIVTAFQIALASLSNTFVGLIDTLTVKWQMLNYSSADYQSLLQSFSSLIGDYDAFVGETLADTALPTVLYGIRSKAFTVYNLIPTLVISVSVSAIPLLSSAFSAGDKDSLNDRIYSTLRLSSLIIFPASFGIFAISGQITDLLYGASVSSDLCGEFLKIYGITAIFTGFSIVFGSLLQSMGAEKQAFINMVIGLTAKLIFNFVLVGNISLNILGSAYATLICFVVIFLLNLISVLKRVKFFLIIKSVYKPLISALICIIPAVLISNFMENTLGIILSICSAAAVYVFFLLIFKTFSRVEIGKILKKIS